MLYLYIHSYNDACRGRLEHCYLACCLDVETGVSIILISNSMLWLLLLLAYCFIMVENKLCNMIGYFKVIVLHEFS